MVWYTRRIGVGEPISLAILEPLQTNATLQQLTDKLHRYLEDEFGVKVHNSYLLDVDTKQFSHSETGVVINLPSDILLLLQQNQIITDALPHSLKSATALLPLTYNGFLIGFVAVNQLVTTDVHKNLQPFAGLMYQTLFASYLKTA